MTTLPRRSLGIVLFLFAVCCTLVLQSCPAPITAEHLLHAKDSLAPEITVLCPADASCYAALLLVSGTVTDSARENGDGQGSVRTFSYAVLSTAVAGTATVDEGMFQFVLDMRGLTGTQTLQLRATDWNGNVGTRLITLVDPGSEIPSFALESGNHEVTLTWDPVPGAESYSVYYTTDGSYPDMPQGTNGTAIDGVQPGVVVTGTESGGARLGNGAIHVFKLRAHMPPGIEDLYSACAPCVPLSSMTLAPKVVSNQSGKITVSWMDAGVGVRYDLWKSEKPDTGFYRAASSTGETELIDRAVMPGEQYWYRVSLVDLSDIQSMAVPGSSCGLGDSGASDMATIPLGAADDFRDVAVHDDVAYVVGRPDRIYLLDLANPDPLHATVRSEVSFPDGYDFGWHQSKPVLPEDVTVSGGVAYVADPFIGLQVVDVSDPDAPGLDYRIDLIGEWTYAWDVFADAGNLFIALKRYVDIYAIPPGQGGAYNSSYDTYGPDPVGRYDVGSGYNRGVVVRNNRAYVTNSGPSGDRPTIFSLVVLDVSDRSNPQLVNQVDLPGAGCAYELDVADVGARAYAFVAKGMDGLLIYDVTDVTDVSPPLPVGTATCTVDARDVVVEGTVAYVADFARGMVAVSVSKPSDPIYLWGRSWPGNGYGIDVDSGYAYLAAMAGGLHILDLGKDVFGLTRTGMQSPQNSTCYDLAVRGDRAYMADGSHGLRIVDIDPQSGTYMNVIATCATPGATVPVSPLNGLDYAGSLYPYLRFGIAVCGDYAFMADGEEGLQVVDVNPDHAAYGTIVGSVGLPGQARDVALAGDYGYVAAGLDGLHVVDVSVPQEPLHVATVDCPGEAWVVEIRGDLAYVAAGTGGVSIFDINRRWDPVLLGTCYLPPLSSDTRDTEKAIDIAVKDQVLYVAFTDLYWANYSDWVIAVDVSNPSAPEILTKIPVPIACTSLDVSGDYLVVACSRYWEYDSRLHYLQIYDVSDPRGALLRGEFRLDVPSSSTNPPITQCRKAIVRDDTIYCADVQLIMQAFSVSQE